MANDLKHHELTWRIENVCFWGKLLETVVNGPNFTMEEPGSPWMLKLGQSTKFNGGIVLFIKRLSKNGDVIANVHVSAYIDNNANPLLLKNFRIKFNNDSTWESPILCKNQWFKSLTTGNNMCRYWDIRVKLLWQEYLNYPPNTNMSFIRQENVGIELKEYVGKEKFSDIYIKVKDEEYIPAHKAILAARCPHLSRKIDSRPGRNWKNINEELFPSEDPEVVSAVLKYLYTGNVKCVTETNPLPIDIFDCAANLKIENLERFTQPYYFKGKTSIKVQTVEFEWDVGVFEILMGTEEPVTKESEPFGNPLEELFVLWSRFTPPKENSPGSIKVFLKYQTSRNKRNISVVVDFKVKDGEGKLMLRKKSADHDMAPEDSLLCVNIFDIHELKKVNPEHQNLNFTCEVQYSKNETDVFIIGVPSVKTVYQVPLGSNPVKRHMEKVYYFWIADTINNFKTLLFNDKHSDCILVIGRERLPAHKVILAARSSYFLNVLSRSSTPSESAGPMEVYIEKDFRCMKIPVFKIILEEIYTGSAGIPPELSEEISSAARMFGLRLFDKTAWAEFEFYKLEQKLKDIPG